MPKTAPNAIKKILFTLTVWALFFGALEAVSRVFFVSPGAKDYVERRILEQGLRKAKAPGEFRILFYGESTMQGDALYPKSTLDKWVLLYLEDLLPEHASRRVKTYNLARLGANSRFITQSFLDTVSYQPDLVVFYMAHNDFVQLDNRHSNLDPTPLRFGQKGYFRELGRALVKKSAFLSELNRLSIRLKIARHEKRDARAGKKEELTIETWEKFYSPTYDTLDRGSPVYQKIFEHWRHNGQSIISECQKKHIPVVFFESLANYREYPPNESGHDPSLTGTDLDRWSQRYAQAEYLFQAGDYGKALEGYEHCKNIDPGHAMTYYRLGQCYERLSRFEEARACYLAASDRDRVPLRAPSDVNRYYEELRGAALPGVYVIQSQEVLEIHSPSGMVGGDLVLDTMHPSLKGQALLALEIVKLIYEKGLLVQEEGWNWGALKSSDALREKLGFDENFEAGLYLQKASYVGRFYDKAIEYSKRSLALQPDSLMAKRSLAWAYWRKGEEEKAVAIYSDVYDKTPREILKVFSENPDLARQVWARRKLLGRATPGAFV
ncbi:MAG: tetratricopeptide repeat protein [Candidatus Omnitrophica bacterium]|nr:tetratricopeptide repeat protein [Candidatus Omnitrophota bacterium]